MWRPESAFDVMSGGVVYGLCTNTQHQGFNTTQHWLLPTPQGAINTTTIHDATVAMFGGPYPHVSVKHYEVTAGLTPVYFYGNATHCTFKDRSDTVVAALPWSVVGSGHEDMFVIEVFTESAGNNLIFIIYGFDWLGTWGGGIYFKEVIYPNLSTYTDDYYIFHWIDTNEDGIPQSSEIHEEASG